MPGRLLLFRLAFGINADDVLERSGRSGIKTDVEFLRFRVGEHYLLDVHERPFRVWSLDVYNIDPAAPVVVFDVENEIGILTQIDGSRRYRGSELRRLRVERQE